MKENWQISKAGFLNFWYYDDQIFEFENGRLLLRGSNGSGKSVTMQSLIPLLLDGDRRPERLDPFGSKARKLESYLLEDGSNEAERTGYIYLEFKKEDKESFKAFNYYTIGLGIKAIKNQKLDLWGFCIRNKRVGLDISLTKNLDIKIPLSKKELKSKLDKDGAVFNSTREYADEVNKSLFGYQSFEEFEELLKLLLQLRTPKLSKDFKPTIMYEIMTNSLPTLSDDDLRPISEAIENMDKYKSNLEQLQQSKLAIDKIFEVYNRYNQILLLEKSKSYLKIYNEFENTKTLLLSSQKNLQKSEQKFEIEKERYLNLKQEQKFIEQKYDQLREHDIFKLENKFKELKDSKAENEIEKSKAEKKLNETKQKERQIYSQINKIQSEIDKITVYIKDELDEMSILADDIKFDEHEFFKDELLQNLYKPYSYELTKSSAHQYQENFILASKLMAKQENALTDYDNKYKELSLENNRKAKKEKDIQQADQLLSQTKTELIENIYKYNNNNTYIKLEKNILDEIKNLIWDFDENSLYETIMKVFNNECAKFKDKINFKILVKAQEIQNKSKELEDKEKQIKMWQQKKETEPERSKEAIENRKNLKQRGISFVPLYKALDFNSNVDDKTKGIIEEALINMGLLDALIVEDKYKSEILDLTVGEDKYIFADTTLLNSELNKYLISENIENINLQNIQTIIQNILFNSDKSNIYINDDRTYSIGIIKGKVSQNAVSRFIGSNSRELYRKQIIDELKNEKEIVLTELQILNNELSDLKNIKLQIEQEINNFPKGDDLYVAVKTYINYLSELELIKKNIDQKNDIVKKAYNVLNQIKQECFEILQKVPFRSSDQLDEASTTTGNYIKQLTNIEIRHRELLNHCSNLENYKSTQIEVQDSIEDINDTINKLERRIKLDNQKIDDIEVQLKMSDVDEIKQEIENCRKRKDELPSIIEGSINIKSRTENSINNLKFKIDELQIQLQQNSAEFQNKQIEFEKELNLKYIDKIADMQFDSSLKAANYIIDNLNINEDISSEEYLNIVFKVFGDEKNYLSQYNTEIVPLNNRKGSRIYIISKIDQQQLDFKHFRDFITYTLEDQINILKEEDRKIFQDILTNTIGKKISSKISFSENWVKKMNSLMENLNTSSGLTFSLKWVSKKADSEEQLNTSQLIEFLKKDNTILTEKDISSFSNHFKYKINKVQQEAQNQKDTPTFYSMIKDIFDYRQWFEFKLYYKKTNEKLKELTNNAFFTLSGGEKAMAMYVPLFSAVYSKYEYASKDCLRIISLDEAFAGVDSKNIRDMFKLLIELDLDFIVNSQVLWGDYDTVNSLAIYELLRPNNANYITPIRYTWNGKIKEMVGN